MESYTDEQGKDWTFPELIAERDRLDDMYQEQFGANLMLEDDKKALAKALELHCIVCVRMRGHKEEWCDKCTTTIALKTTGMEVTT